jgi:hypothetical protein
VPVRVATRRLTIAALAALAVLVAALTLTPITNNDLFLHLTTGRVVLETGHVPRVDDYSALARGRPFVAHEWLAGVIFRIVEAMGGLDALILLKAAVALSTAAALYAAARRLGASPVAALPSLALVMILAAARIMERPHIFSYLLASLFLLLLARRRSGGRAPLWVFVPLQILWANLHGGFVLGPLLLFLAAAGEAAEGLALGLSPDPRVREGRAAEARRRLREAAALGATCASCLAGCLVNPYGWRIATLVFGLTQSSFMGEIYEWQPPFASDFRETYMMRYYLVWAAVGVGVLSISIRRAVRGAGAPPGGAFTFFVFGTLLTLSLRMQRNVTDFALGTLPGVAAAATWMVSRRNAADGGGAEGPREDGDAGPRPAHLAVIAAGLLLLACWFAARGYPYRPGNRRLFGFGVGANIPVAAADYLQANGIAGNAFNTYSAGSYLVYRFYPRVRVGMDSRNDVYGEALYRDYVRALTDAPALQAMLRRLEASFVVLEWVSNRTAGTFANLRALGGWSLVYFDDNVAIFLPLSGPRGSIAVRDSYTVLDPSRYRPGELPPDRAARALEEAGRAVAGSPGAWLPRVMRVDALRAGGRPREAAEAEAAILADRPRAGWVYVYLGYLRLAAREAGEAETLFRRALEVNPGDRLAQEALRRVGADAD